jgi:aspartyl-tRNA(Asn)/glutamyl-tRNA(Gln) amidotransferase subunit C
MKITREEVLHVAQLARLKLPEETLERLTGQMNDILTYMDKLGELDTSGVPPTNHALELTGAFREDLARPSLERDQGLANAPASDGQSFVVPKVV